MLQWSSRARAAIAYLFQPLQDLDVYVEDLGDEVFYLELLKRACPKNIRLCRVFAAGNRNAVIEKARVHDFKTRKALFLIDGDFEWLRDEPAPSVDGTYRLNAYCIENLLIQEEAATQILIEDEAISETEATRLLAFESWVRSVSEHLIELFISFAILNAAAPAEPTVGQGVNVVITARKKGKLPLLDPKKVARLREATDSKIISIIGQPRFEELRTTLLRRVSSLSAPIGAVSGKDFLLPLF